MTVVAGFLQRIHVPKTGDFTKYVKTETGPIEIPAGTWRLAIRSVVLKPVK